jgi:hypothetical protein
MYVYLAGVVIVLLGTLPDKWFDRISQEWGWIIKVCLPALGLYIIFISFFVWVQETEGRYPWWETAQG